ncbi:hypothetical protein I5535_14035 [Rhodobacteraceae bacterium F11138]|nr:hypothetical protein [Rhodobacteraceae bacterium F11138]
MGSGGIRKTLNWLRAILVVAILSATVGLIATQVIGLKRSFVIEARSSHLDLMFLGDLNRWYFGKATICRPAQNPDPRRAADPSAPCPDNIYDIEESTDYTLEWPDGSGVRLTLDPEGDLTMEIGQDFLFDGPEAENRHADNSTASLAPPGLPEGTLILVPASAWLKNAALTFEGRATIGQNIRSGVTHYLHEGRWEARQTTPLIWWVRPFTEVIKEGYLHRGVEVTVVDRKRAPVKVFGHVTPFLGDDRPAFFMVMSISEPGRTELRLGHFGLREPAVVRPDLFDIAGSSAIFVAAIAVLTILAALTQILSDLFARSGPGTDKPDPETDTQSQE